MDIICITVFDIKSAASGRANDVGRGASTNPEIHKEKKGIHKDNFL